MSSAVHDQIIGHIEAPVTALGAKRLKNIPEPVEVWQIELVGTKVNAVSPGDAVAYHSGQDSPAILKLPLQFA